MLVRLTGSFFDTYPRHDRLISINKRHTGKTNKEFNMRHDWNSLLSHDESLQMRHYSKVSHCRALVTSAAKRKYARDWQIYSFT